MSKCRNCGWEFHLTVEREYCLWCRRMYWAGWRSGFIFAAFVLIVLVSLFAGRASAQTLERHDGPIRIELTLDQSLPILVENKVLYPTGPGQTAITVTGPRRESAVLPTLILRNVLIAAGNAYHWQHCAWLTNAWLATIENVTCNGPAGMPEPLTENAFILDGQSTDVILRGVRVSGTVTGVFIKGEAEGTRIVDATLMGVRHGIVAWPDSGGGEPGLWVSGTHINAVVHGIYLRHRYHVFLRDILIYAGDYFASTKGLPFYGLVAEDAQEVQIDRVLVSRNGAEARDKPIVPQTLTRSQNVDGKAEVTRW